MAMAITGRSLVSICRMPLLGIKSKIGIPTIKVAIKAMDINLIIIVVLLVVPGFLVKKPPAIVENVDWQTFIAWQYS